MKKLFFVFTFLTLSIFSTVCAHAYNPGWKYEDGHWCYILENLTRYKGWLEDFGDWYYLDNDGYMVTDKWIDNYYLDYAGRMMKDALTPDGYIVGEDGVWIPGERFDIDNGTFVTYAQRLLNMYAYNSSFDANPPTITVEGGCYKYDPEAYIGSFLVNLPQYVYELPDDAKYQIQNGNSTWQDVSRAEFINNVRKTCGGIFIFTRENGKIKELKLRINE